MKLYTLLALFVFASADISPAQDVWKPDTRIGDFQFNMPKGWKKTPGRNGGPMLVPTNLPQDSTAAIDFLPPHELNGDLRSFFNAAWADWQRQFKVVQAGKVEEQHHPNGFDLLRVDARISNQQLGYCEFVLVVAQVGHKAESYYFLSNAGYYSYRNDFDDLGSSLSFANNPAARSRAAAKPGSVGGLDGLYVGYKMRGLTGLKTHFEYLVFFPDGNVMRFLPEPGLDNFDFRKALRSSRDYCGRYSVAASRVTIEWADNNTENAARSGQDLKISGDSYFLVSKDDGLMLKGTYRREGSDLAQHFIRFSADGHFVENGMLPLLAYSGSNSSPGNGQYTISSNTLHLNYSDGRKIKLSFFIFSQDEAGERPGMIHVNTYVLLREK